MGHQWLSANMVVSSFAIGILGTELFELGAADAMLVCLFFNLLGIIPVCWFSGFGPIFGLRQMVLSRFWFGWYGVKLSKNPDCPLQFLRLTWCQSLASTSWLAWAGLPSTPSSVLS